MSRAAVGIYAPVASSPPPMVSTSAQAMEAIKTLHTLKSEGLISDARVPFGGQLCYPLQGATCHQTGRSPLRDRV